MWSILIAVLVLVIGVQSEVVYWMPLSPVVVATRRVSVPRRRTSGRSNGATSHPRDTSEYAEWTVRNLDADRVARHIEGILTRVKYLPNCIEVYRVGDAYLTIDFDTEGRISSSGKFGVNGITVAGLIGMDGPLGGSWDPMLAEIARQVATALVRENSVVADRLHASGVRGAINSLAHRALEHLDPDKESAARWWLARSIREMAGEHYIAQLEALDYWVDNARHADGILSFLQDIDLDVRDLDERDYAVVWEYVSLIRDRANLPYTDWFVSRLEARTVREMERELFEFHRDFDGAFATLRCQILAEEERRERILRDRPTIESDYDLKEACQEESYAGSMRARSMWKDMPLDHNASLPMEGISWSGDTTDYLAIYQESLAEADADYESEYYADAYALYGNRRGFREMPKRDNQDRRMAAPKRNLGRGKIAERAALRSLARAVESDRASVLPLRSIDDAHALVQGDISELAVDFTDLQVDMPETGCLARLLRGIDVLAWDDDDAIVEYRGESHRVSWKELDATFH